MKKLILSAVVSLAMAAFPTVGLTSVNSFLQSMQKARAALTSGECASGTQWGACQEPGTGDWCGCFWGQAQQQCPSYHPPSPSICKIAALFKAEVNQLHPPYICTHYRTPGTDTCACEEELQYFVDNC